VIWLIFYRAVPRNRTAVSKIFSCDGATKLTFAALNARVEQGVCGESGVPGREKRRIAMDITNLLIQLVSGAIGGNLAGMGLKKYSLGMLGNSIAGILGGGIGAQILGPMIASAAEGILGDIASGTIGGAVLMIIVGVIKQMMGK
jgi:uncharacterized membrane protein YeaQ/YmgE (transglycosylase-associated protein family)